MTRPPVEKNNELDHALCRRMLCAPSDGTFQWRTRHRTRRPPNGEARRIQSPRIRGSHSDGQAGRPGDSATHRLGQILPECCRLHPTPIPQPHPNHGRGFASVEGKRMHVEATCCHAGMEAKVWPRLAPTPSGLLTHKKAPHFRARLAVEINGGVTNGI